MLFSISLFLSVNILYTKHLYIGRNGRYLRVGHYVATVDVQANCMQRERISFFEADTKAKAILREKKTLVIISWLN